MLKPEANGPNRLCLVPFWFSCFSLGGGQGERELDGGRTEWDQVPIPRWHHVSLGHAGP